MKRRRTLTVDEYVEGVRAGDRAVLGRAISLVESTRSEHMDLAQQVLVRLLPHTGSSHRVGITGVPGVGKSTFIETLGNRLVAGGHKVAVLAVDPSSSVSGGSILGDKTRMATLSRSRSAFIRPSPTSGSLGGVGRKTRETILLVEAAGYDVVLVETVGVGQSETLVADMVDFFMVLMLPGAGDELQGIKKGILEVADLIAVNKADSNERAARLARRDYKNALHYLKPASPNWTPEVVLCSGLKGSGVDELWELVESHRETMSASGERAQRRRTQERHWMWQMVEERVLRQLHDNEQVRALSPKLERALADGTVTATLAATRLLEAFGMQR